MQMTPKRRLAAGRIRPVARAGLTALELFTVPELRRKVGAAI